MEAFSKMPRPRATTSLSISCAGSVRPVSAGRIAKSPRRGFSMAFLARKGSSERAALASRRCWTTLRFRSFGNRPTVLTTKLTAPVALASSIHFHEASKPQAPFNSAYRPPWYWPRRTWTSQVGWTLHPGSRSSHELFEGPDARRLNAHGDDGPRRCRISLLWPKRSNFSNVTLRMKFVQARCGAPCRKQLAELRVKAVESTQDGWGGFAS
jgi:hypothetical protein